MATIFRPPLIRNPLLTPPYRYYDIRPSGRVAPAADTFYDGPGKAPCFDWPNPKTPYYDVSLRTWTRSLNLNLISQDQFFTSAGRGPTYDYPNPKTPYYDTSLRTWGWSYNKNLISLDTFFGGPGVGPDYDYPNPKTPYYSNQFRRTWFVNLQEYQLAPTLPLPYNQYDWPNPKVAPYPVTNRTLALSFDRNLHPSLDAFFSGPGVGPDYDYPNPKTPYYSNTFRTWLQSLSLLGKDVFFTSAGRGPTYDYPNPKVAPYPTTNRTWTQSPSLFGQDIFFTSAGRGPTYDYPNPKTPYYDISLRVCLQNLQQSTLFIVPYPYNQYDWPTPKTPYYVNQLRTITEAYTLSLIGKDKIYGAPGEVPSYDWPNPKTARSQRETLNQTVSIIPFPIIEIIYATISATLQPLTAAGNIFVMSLGKPIRLSTDIRYGYK